MKKILPFLMLLSGLCFGQPDAVLKIASQTSTENLKKNLYHLASDKMEGRLMASHGDTLASLFIADWFRKNKITPPYAKGKSYFQPITIYRVISTEKLSIGNKTYQKPGNWTATKDLAGLDQVQVLIPFFNNPDSLIRALAHIDARGKAMIIPTSLDLKIGAEENQERFRAKIAASGIVTDINAGAVTDRTIENLKKKSFLPQYVDSTTAFSVISGKTGSLTLTQDRLNELLAADHITFREITDKIASGKWQGFLLLDARISVEIKKSYQKTTAPNVIGLIKGSDPAAECVIISAHHDHDGRNGNQIYYGAVDNASGTVAIMEVALMMNKAVKQGFRPKRTIVFASFTGEERGLLGSSYYAEHPILPISKTRAIMNIDMMGRVDTIYSGKKADSSYAYILVKDSLDIGLRKSLYKANETVKLNLDKRYEQPQFALEHGQRLAITVRLLENFQK